jgi:hypothetical protein
MNCLEMQIRRKKAIGSSDGCLSEDVPDMAAATVVPRHVDGADGDRCRANEW